MLCPVCSGILYERVALMMLRNDVIVVYGVHAVIDSNVTYIVVGEKYLDICTRFKIIPPQT